MNGTYLQSADKRRSIAIGDMGCSTIDIAMLYIKSLYNDPYDDCQGKKFTDPTYRLLFSFTVVSYTGPLFQIKLHLPSTVLFNGFLDASICIWILQTDYWDMPPRRYLLELPFRYPYFKSSHCNSFEDRAPVDFIYGCLIFVWVAETWLHGRVWEY